MFWLSYFLRVALWVSRSEYRVRQEQFLPTTEGKGPSMVSFSWHLGSAGSIP